MRPCWVIATLFLAACGPSGDDSAAASECMGLGLELGEGAFSWSAREDGEPVTMTHGQQGGWHIDLAGYVTGTTGTLTVVPSVIEANQQVSLAGIGQEAGQTVTLPDYDPGACDGTFFAVRAFLDDVDPGGPYQRFICTLEDNALEVSATITDEGTGETASDSFLAIAALDPDDVSICAGY